TDVGRFEVGSYHDWGLSELGADLVPSATAADGSIEGFRNTAGTLIGIMWHPERETPVRACDLDIFKTSAG
ncbi:MAG: hypothetical protein FJX59_20960, partial [Alphaproteobacteria bacterium]|nr:hypothetical protein [Alphaproteobacteria bacterium]